MLHRENTVNFILVRMWQSLERYMLKKLTNLISKLLLMSFAHFDAFFKDGCFPPTCLAKPGARQRGTYGYARGNH